MNLGSAMILYINDLPVGCLTSNSLSETIDFLRTCKTTAKGAITQLPRLYGYSIPFEAVMVLDGALMSWEDIRELARNRIKVSWDIINAEVNAGDAGVAFIENLQLTGSTEDFIKFTGTLTGYGAIVDADTTYPVWYGAPGRPVDEVGRYVFLDTPYVTP